MTGIKVLAVVSEIYPLVKTGGLADVAGALPRALGPHGVAMADVPHLICGGGPCPYQFVLDDAGIVNSPVALKLVPKEWAAMARQ